MANQTIFVSSDDRRISVVSLTGSFELASDERSPGASGLHATSEALKTLFGLLQKFSGFGVRQTSQITNTPGSYRVNLGWDWSIFFGPTGMQVVPDAGEKDVDADDESNLLCLALLEAFFDGNGICLKDSWLVDSFDDQIEQFSDKVAKIEALMALEDDEASPLYEYYAQVSGLLEECQQMQAQRNKLVKLIREGEPAHRLTWIMAVSSSKEPVAETSGFVRANRFKLSMARQQGFTEVLSHMMNLGCAERAQLSISPDGDMSHELKLTVDAIFSEGNVYYVMRQVEVNKSLADLIGELDLDHDADGDVEQEAAEPAETQNAAQQAVAHIRANAPDDEADFDAVLVGPPRKEVDRPVDRPDPKDEALHEQQAQIQEEQAAREANGKGGRAPQRRKRGKRGGRRSRGGESTPDAPAPAA